MMECRRTARVPLSRPAVWGGCLLAAITLTVSPGSHARAEDQLYSVGVAKQDVTPDYPVRLNGFGFRREESEGVTQPIWAKAIAIGTDDEKPLVLITLDNLGVRETLVDEVARRLKDRCGIERDRVAVTFSHTHTAPKVVDACDTIFSSPIPPEHQARIERYSKELTDAMEAVAVAALASRGPSTLEWGVGRVGFAKNRRPQGGPVDHSLPMLVVKSAADGTVRAVYTTYACHCVTLSHNKISGDWAGFAQRAIEARCPGAIALISIGCGSDANPDSGVTGDNVAVAAAQGDQIADEVQRLLNGPLSPITGSVSATLTHLDLPLKAPPTPDQLRELSAEDSPAGYNAKYQLAKLQRGESLLTSLRYPIQTWEFGDSMAMVFLGGEICCDYAVRLREKLDPHRIWLTGYSNDFGAYIPSERLLKEGGYGGGADVVFFSLPATLAAGLESKILTQVCKQVSPCFLMEEPADSSRTGSRSSYRADNASQAELNGSLEPHAANVSGPRPAAKTAPSRGRQAGVKRGSTEGPEITLGQRDLRSCIESAGHGPATGEHPEAVSRDSLGERSQVAIRR